MEIPYGQTSMVGGMSNMFVQAGAHTTLCVAGSATAVADI